jgi:hypothetical protein
LKVRPIPDDASSTSNQPACRHVRENSFGNLEMAASLDFSNFQQIGWK